MDSKKFLELYKSKKNRKRAPWSGATGVYMISPSCPANFHMGEKCENPIPQNVKIGKATSEGGLASRIKSYSTYWPSGTTVHALLVTPSYDAKYGTIRDYATARETTLKRILRQPETNALGFGSDGKGGKNGTERIPSSEWVNMEPSRLIRYFDAVGPKRHPADKLYTCNENRCELVDLQKHTLRPRTRAYATAQPNNLTGTNWKALEAVLKNEHERGIPGRPVVLTKATIDFAKNKTHPLHIWANKLVSNDAKDKELVQRRLRNRENRKVHKANRARVNKERGILTREQRLRAKKIYKKKLTQAKKLPRNLEAIRNTANYAIAPKQVRDGRARVKKKKKKVQPGKKRPAPNKNKYIQGVFGKSTKVRPLSTQAQSAEGSKPNNTQRYHYDQAVRQARKRNRHQLNDNFLPRKLENEILADKEDIYEISNHDSSPCPSTKRIRGCKSSARIIKEYPRQGYTHYDVTGDGLCYFYVILKALVMRLTAGGGAPSNLSHLFHCKNKYFEKTEDYRKYLGKVQRKSYGNPSNVISISPLIRQMLYERGIRYIAHITLSRNEPDKVDKYMRRPLTHAEEISTIHGPDRGYRQQILSEEQIRTHLVSAMGRHEVIVFVYKNYPIQSEHFTVIIPTQSA